MIGPSRRRGVTRTEREPMRLHSQLARSRDMQRRLFVGSVLALLAALVCWILGLTLPLRALITVLAGAVGMALPVRGGERWALELIRSQAGLSYQTALEGAAEPGDRYGFREALVERAQETTRRVEAPPKSNWWLPIMMLALGALLLPSLPLAGFSGTSGNGLSSGPAGGGPPPAAAAEEEAEEQESLQQPEESSPRVEPSGQPGDATTETTEADGSREGGSVGEQAALERFLENVRERPQVDEEEREPESSGEGTAPQGEPGSGGRPENAQERQGESEGTGEGETSREGEQQGRSQEGEEGEQQGEGQGQGSSQGSQEGSPGEEESGGEGESEQQQGNEPGSGAAAGSEESLSPGEEGAEALGPGDQEGDQQGGQGQGAGGTGTEEQPAGIALGANGEELFIEGELQSGPIESGGMIQLPGNTQVPLPPGRDPASYSREVERSVSEGRIPLEYQEVIRNYFR